MGSSLMLPFILQKYFSGEDEQQAAPTANPPQQAPASYAPPLTEAVGPSPFSRGIGARLPAHGMSQNGFFPQPTQPPAGPVPGFEQVPPETIQRAQAAKARNPFAGMELPNPYVEQAGQQAAGIAQAGLRRHQLTNQGFREFPSSSPGSIFYKQHGQQTGSAFGQRYKPTQGTASFGATTGNELARQNADQRIQTAGQDYRVKVAEAQAQDPFGLQQLREKTRIQNESMLQANQAYQQARTQLDNEFSQGIRSPENYQAALERLERDRAFMGETYSPKSGFERMLVPGM